jgi:tetratricopeptide (TPR) repeat protein
MSFLYFVRFFHFAFFDAFSVVQTALLRLKVEELQRAFNAKFDAAVELKKAEIYRLDEKAERVKEINEESRGEEPLFKPRMSKEERPETIFEVDESEITAERVLTKEEQAKKDAEEAEKAERARKAAEDDSRDRALLDMMNGTLVIKKDVSALDKQLVKEEWMTTIPYDKMSDEQKVQLADFEKREKTLATERENRRKLLDTDLKKVRGEIADICRFFDEKLQVLLDERMVVKQKCCTQELIIAKLMNSLLEEEERDREEVNLARRERELHTEKTTASMALNEFRRQVDACQKKADALAKEEKDLERNCRKEMFEMASDQLEMLMKLYKNRRVRRHITPDISASSPAPATAGGAPKVSMMMSLAMMSLAASGKASEQTQHILKTKGAMKAAGDADHESEDEDNMQDPFSEQTGKVAAAEVATRLAEMQFDPSEKPDDLEPEVWERLQKLRNLKIEKEMEAKAHGTILEDMRRHEAALIATEKALNDELVSTVNRKVAAREQRETLQLNTELLMQVRQGQVEIEEAPVVTDMSSAVMINRSIVEQLNGSIVSLGSETVQQLREIVYLRKGIRAQRWQQRRMQLQFEEYADRTIEFQLLRVTRELQDMIKSGGHEARQSNEIAKLEKKIEYTRQMTDTKIADRTYKLNKVLKKVRDMQEENRRLDQTIVELQNSVAERQNIWRIRQKDAPMPGTEGSGHEGSEAEAQRKRVAAVVERRRLVELAKQQAEEIEFLKSELERCRKRTFPSFQQMVPTHPDMK